jgi:hypothetical protein
MRKRERQNMDLKKCRLEKRGDCVHHMGTYLWFDYHLGGGVEGGCVVSVEFVL